MATRKKAETVETVETAAAITEEVATTAQVEAVAEQTTNVPQKVTFAPNVDTFQAEQAYNKVQAARYATGEEYFKKAKELVELDIEARKAGLEKCLKLFQTISDTPSNDIQIRQIEQATQLYKALTNGPCY